MIEDGWYWAAKYPMEWMRMRGAGEVVRTNPSIRCFYFEGNLARSDLIWLQDRLKDKLSGVVLGS